jgi:hypothetical protein
MRSISRSGRRALASGLFLLSVAVPMAGAATGTLAAKVAALTANPTACQARTLTQPFTPWSDTASYFLVAGGTFEGGATGWTLTGGAQARSGGEPFLAGSTASSLDLPAGASATSPVTCVDPGAPTLRFFAIGAGSKVDVSVLIGKVAVSVGTITPTNTWAPTPTVLYLANALSVLSPTGTLNVSFRFTASGAEAHVDDVYVDPYRRT